MELIHSAGAIRAQAQRRVSASRLAPVYDLVITAVVMLFASYAAWNHWRIWEHSIVFVQAVAMAGVLVVGKWVLLRRPFRTPVDRLALSVLWFLFVFLGLLSWIIFARTYYSRSFLLVSFALLFAWQVLDALVLRSHHQPLRLGAVPSELTMRLAADSGLDIRLLPEPTVNVAIDGIVVDMHHELPEEWARFLAESTANGIPIYHAASIYEAATSRVSLDYAHADWLRELFLGSAAYLPVKRALDIVLVLLSLPIVVPLCLVVGLLVKFSSPGPVLFWQERIGERGRVFRIVKFRSMRVDAERNGAQFAASDDERITPVGRVLRRYRLDELPQLWNVLKGDMSIVGPRPEQVEFARRFEERIPFYHWRHRVKPGITGWAQVQQGYAVGIEDTIQKLEYDLYYVKHLSLWLDLSILLRTVRIVVTGFGAR